MALYLFLFLTLVATVQQCHAEENTFDLRMLGIPVVIPAVDYTKDNIFQSILSGNISYQNVADILNADLKEYGGIDACNMDIAFVLSGLSNPYGQQFKYIDAAAKVPYGILQGKLIWVGDYQECYSIPEMTNPLTRKTFKGNYFSGVLSLNGKGLIGGNTISIGLCLPNSCNSTSAAELINNALYSFTAKYSFLPKNLTFTNVTKDEDKPMEGGAIGMVVISGILVLLVVLGTMVDALHSNRNKPMEPVVKQSAMYDEPHLDRTGLLAEDAFADDIQMQPSRWSYAKEKLLDIVLAFSFLKNSSKLFNTDTAVGPLACLNGLRVLSMTWVILGHTYAFCIYFLDNVVETEKIVQRFSFQPILNGTFSVDSFFFLSGLLVAYLAMKEYLEKEKFNWLYYFLHRYWRLTPLYAYVIFFYAYLLIFFISGPFKTTIASGFEENFHVCQKYWFSNLLYFNNFYPDYGSLSTTCLGWSWYLANDMQFYLFLSPVVLVLFMYSRRYLPSSRRNIPGITCAAQLIVACIVIRAVLVSYYGLYGFTGQPTKHVNDHMAKSGPLYARPYTRMSVYVVGMLTGVVLAEYRNRIMIPKLMAFVGWCISIATALAVVYGQYYYNHRSNLLDPIHSPHMTLTQSVFYVSLSRTAWGLCLSWLVLASVAGKGGWVTEILSWKIWAPLGRLTYAAYLIHPMVIFGYFLNLLQPLHFSDWVLINIFLSCLVVTYGLSFVLSMFLEAPMLQLEKVILKLGQSTKLIFKRLGQWIRENVNYLLAKFNRF